MNMGDTSDYPCLVSADRHSNVIEFLHKQLHYVLLLDQ
jgi:hypothetical protein